MLNYVVKHCVMKTRGSGGIAPCFLTSARAGGDWSVSPRNSPRYLLDRRLVGPHGQPGRYGQEKNPLPYLELYSGRPARNLVFIPTEPFQLYLALLDQ
jgi:hypothetical protein